MNFVAFERAKQGTGASRRLRNAGKVPGIVYGGEGQPQLIELDHNALWQAIKKEAFHSSVLDMELAGQVSKVLLRDLQIHPYKQLVLHVDFQRVDANQALRTKVQLHFKNQDKSPAGKTGGVVIMHELTEIEISCLPKDLPAAIEVDLSDLAIGGVVHLSGLTLPAGVEIPALKLGKEHDVAVVVAKHGKEEVVDAAAPATAEVPATKAAKKDAK